MKERKNISIILEMSDTFCKILKWKSHHQSAGDREKIQVFNYEAWNYFFLLLHAFSYQNHNLPWRSTCHLSRQIENSIYIFFMVQFVYLYHLFLFVTDIATINMYSNKKICVDVKSDCFLRFGMCFHEREYSFLENIELEPLQRF